MKPMKLRDQVPQSYPVGIVKIRCSCGEVHEIDSQELVARGLLCENCGFKIDARGDIVKKAGKQIMRRYSAGHDR